MPLFFKLPIIFKYLFHFFIAFKSAYIISVTRDFQCVNINLFAQIGNKTSRSISAAAGGIIKKVAGGDELQQLLRDLLMGKPIIQPEELQDNGGRA